MAPSHPHCAFGLMSVLMPLVFSSPARAQQIRVLLKDEANSSPVAGALVRLLDEEHGTVARSLSTASGRAVLDAPRSGRYRIRVDQIGGWGVLSQPLQLRLHEVRDTVIAVSTGHITLPTIDVNADSPCGPRTDEGSFAARLWAEIEKVLVASQVTEASPIRDLIVQRTRRELRRDGSLIHEWVEYAAPLHGQFFEAPPAQTLARIGFIYLDQQDSLVFVAPSAEVLLSDEFVRTHCFRGVAGDSGLVGLQFAPVPGRAVPDVSGTLWVRRETSTLGGLDFHYAGLPKEYSALGLGGRIAYDRLPDGVWIVSRWTIRIPQIESLPERGGSGVQTLVAGRQHIAPVTSRIAGLLEVEGKITPLNSAPSSYNRSIVTGRLFDSTSSQGLSGAVVSILGDSDTAISDAEGRFVLTTAAVGQHQVQAIHAKLGLTGSATQIPVLLSLGDTTTVMFAVPSIRTLARASCGSRTDQAGILGIVLDQAGKPVSGLTVHVNWRTPSGGEKSRSDDTGKSGVFALCNLPPDLPLELSYSKLSAVPLRRIIQLDWADYRWVEFHLP